MCTRPDTILITGPTASGKSRLAMALAERVNGTIINADSMQVYQDLRILTARPSTDDEARVPHRLYGHVDAATAYSAGHYASDVTNALAEVHESRRTAIIVGGTGLYFKVLLEGLSPVPEIDPKTRAYWRGRAQEQTAQSLHDVLADMDPVMATRLVASDRQRIVRALEVIDQTGRSLADWQTQPGRPVLHADAASKLVIAPPRDVLHDRANQRFQAMVNGGAVEEVRQLLARKLDAGLPAMRALGVAPIAAWLSGDRSQAAALETGQTETRQYIKRQMTWLKKNMMSWKWISAQQMESQVAEILMFIDR